MFKFEFEYSTLITRMVLELREGTTKIMCLKILLK